MALHTVTGLILLRLFPRDLFKGLYFLIILSMIFSYLLKNLIYVILLTKTLSFWGNNLSVILESLEHDIKILLRWFNLNSLKVNPGRFQFMILGKSLRPKYCLTIGRINVKDSDHVELLGITTDKHLSFKSALRIYVGMRVTNSMLVGY